MFCSRTNARKIEIGHPQLGGQLEQSSRIFRVRTSQLGRREVVAKGSDLRAVRKVHDNRFGNIITDVFFRIQYREPTRAVVVSLAILTLERTPPGRSTRCCHSPGCCHSPEGGNFPRSIGEKPVKCRNPIVIHYAHDMERAKAFYTSVFDVKPLFESPGWTTLDFGAIQLALHILYPNSSDPEAPLPHAGLNLEVDSIEEIQERVEKRGGSLTELREPEGGVPVRVATLKDSEGNGFELRQQP